MPKRRLLNVRENGRYLFFINFQAYQLMCLFLWITFSDFVSFFLSSSSQGSDNVRDIPWPEELVFTVDQKIINEIGHTKELYYKKVKFVPGSLSCY